MEQEQGRKKGPRWSWARSQIGNPRLMIRCCHQWPFYHHLQDQLRDIFYACNHGNHRPNRRSCCAPAHLPSQFERRVQHSLGESRGGASSAVLLPETSLLTVRVWSHVGRLRRGSRQAWFLAAHRSGRVVTWPLNGQAFRTLIARTQRDKTGLCRLWHQARR
jgi:hypothetical protein